MAHTKVTKTGTQNTGAVNTFSYSGSFDVFKATEVQIDLDNVALTYTASTINDSASPREYTVDATAKTVHIGGADLAASNTVVIRPFTDMGAPSPRATYAPGSSITSADLNNNQLQLMRKAMEYDEQKLSSTGGTMTGNLHFAEDINLSFEGATDNTYETTLSVVDPTADRTVKLPNASDTLVGKATTDTLTNKTIDLDANTVTGSLSEFNAALQGDSFVSLTGSETLSNKTLSSPTIGTQFNIGSATITEAELEIIDGATLSTDELNKLDGATASTAELNYVTGVTSGIQSQIDGKQPLDADLTNLASCQTGASAALAALTQTEVETLDGVTSTTAELNILDGVTSTTTELNYVDGVTSNVQTQLDGKQPLDADLTELSSMQTGAAAKVALLTADEVEKIDGLTSSTTELNKLDGVTASATDLNITASMTKQTTISDSDASYPTSGAVVDYVASALQPFGGFEAVADEDSFPTTQPASGVVISINDASGVVVNGSGVSTTARTTGNGSDNVTINGFPSSLYSTTLSAGNGLQVSSTGSSQTYTYHKLLASESDVKQLSDDINDFNSRYRIAGSAPGSNNDEGDLYFDTGSNKMFVYDGSAWGEVTSTGDFKYLVLCNAGTTNAATYNGSDVSYDLKENTTGGSAASVTNAAQLMVSINGVVQKPNTGTNTSGLDGFVMTDTDTIKFTAGPAANAEVFVIQSGSALSINVTGDNTVTEAKLNVSNSPTNDYVLTADATVTGGLKWAETAESSPTTTRGDIIYRGASADQRLAKGTSGQYLQIGANDPVWADVVGAVAGGCIYENDQTISADHTIASGKGAHSVGPITVNATVTVNGNWVVS